MAPRMAEPRSHQMSMAPLGTKAAMVTMMVVPGMKEPSTGSDSEKDSTRTSP